MFYLKWYATNDFILYQLQQLHIDAGIAFVVILISQI